MKTKTLVIGAIAATTLLAGGWALAQSAGHGPGSMRGHGPGAMGPGMMMGMGHGMGPGSMGGMGHGMMKGMGPGMMHEGSGPGLADAARIERLKGELAITPAQETAWAKYAKAVQETAEAMKAMRESVDHGAVHKMTPADRQAFMSGMHEQRQNQFAGLKSAADELLGVLDATQKTKAAEVLPGLASGPGARHGGFAPNRQHRH